ncbi:hypothetical protein J5N97_028557 [Dioscorea zingiberensis]|uniref:Uncharacterized protein n=1 Tax=Dioscorea zingiberensis TaxID=325984 RepID=A0A9D5H4Y9_9LILI|nr:hypothetical protein J5N97_028557 [Dioscorea zingiberensis]
MARGLKASISVDESGHQHFLDATVAYKRAVLNAINYLSRFGYSKEQVKTDLLIIFRLKLTAVIDLIWCDVMLRCICCSPAAHAKGGSRDVRPKSGRVPSGPRVVKRTPDVLRCT